jgi:hypothetical protein
MVDDQYGGWPGAAHDAGLGGQFDDAGARRQSRRMRLPRMGWTTSATCAASWPCSIGAAASLSEAIQHRNGNSVIPTRT